MSKALIFADLHLHSHKQNIDRLHDCLEVLKWTLNQAQENKCKYVFFLGDLFHERSKIDILNYIQAFETFLVFAVANPDIQITMIVGNHDMYHKTRWDVNSIRPMNAIPNITIIEEPKTLQIDNILVDFLPHTENPLKELDVLKQGRDPKTLQLLLAHIAVHGASLNALHGTMSDVLVEYDNEMTQVDAEKLSAWKQVFLGHFHGAQQLNAQVEYVGSPLQLSFGEVNQEKHVIIYDLETFEKKYVINDFSPKHLILPANQIHNFELEKNFVRVIVDNISGEDIVAMKKTLAGKKPASFDFRQKDKKNEIESLEIESARQIIFKADEMLESYIQQTGVPAGLDGKRLLEIGKMIVSDSVV